MKFRHVVFKLSSGGARQILRLISTGVHNLVLISQYTQGHELNALCECLENCNWPFVELIQGMLFHMCVAEA